MSVTPFLVFYSKSKLYQMVKNTNKPLEGIKVLLCHLFTHGEVRLSFLKGFQHEKCLGERDVFKGFECRSLTLFTVSGRP